MATESMSMANVDIGLRSPARSKLLIHLGVILALAGVSVPLVSFVFFLLPGSLFMLPAVFSAVAATGSLLLGTGGFLIFWGFAHVRPDSLPWTLVVAVLMIAAGATGAIAGGVYALLWLGALNFRAADYAFLNLISLVGATSAVALHAGLILGLLALARTFFRRPVAELRPL
jgi:hypothetical protein